MYNFEPYNVLLAIATNIPVLLMTHIGSPNTCPLRVRALSYSCFLRTLAVVHQYDMRDVLNAGLTVAHYRKLNYSVRRGIEMRRLV